MENCSDAPRVYVPSALAWPLLGSRKLTVTATSPSVRSKIESEEVRTAARAEGSIVGPLEVEATGESVVSDAGGAEVVGVGAAVILVVAAVAAYVWFKLRERRSGPRTPARSDSEPPARGDSEGS